MQSEEPASSQEILQMESNELASFALQSRNAANDTITRLYSFLILGHGAALVLLYSKFIDSDHPFALGEQLVAGLFCFGSLFAFAGL